MKRILFAAIAALLPSIADAELILDDFTDPAEARLPGGSKSVVTEGVGDLDATRTIYLWPPNVTIGAATADVHIRVPGQYTVDVEDAPRLITAFAEYSFEPTDLTQGGQYDAVFVDFTFAEGVVVSYPSGNELQAPGVLLIACCDPSVGFLVADFSNAVTAPFPQNDAPYTLIAPLEQFTNRGGGSTEGDFSRITEFELRMGASSGFAPWEVRIDSIRIGRMAQIPEPSALILTVSALFCVLRPCAAIVPAALA